MLPFGAGRPKASCLFVNPGDGRAPNDKGGNDKALDFPVQTASHDIGAAWKKTSEAGREYLSVSLDDPSFPAAVYARLIEDETGTHDLIWSRSKSQAA
jgi:uncharacterized protein (DUF736 family)